MCRPVARVRRWPPPLACQLSKDYFPEYRLHWWRAARLALPLKILASRSFFDRLYSSRAPFCIPSIRGCAKLGGLLRDLSPGTSTHDVFSVVPRTIKQPTPKNVCFRLEENTFD